MPFLEVEFLFFFLLKNLKSAKKINILYKIRNLKSNIKNSIIPYKNTWNSLYNPCAKSLKKKQKIPLQKPKNPLLKTRKSFNKKPTENPL